MSPREMSEQNSKTALEASLEEYRAAACAEADAHFDDRALEAQRHKILAKLEHLGHPAKVIRFPRASQPEVQGGNINRRWISVAAAAGLIIGLLGGQFVHWMPQPTRRLAPLATSAPSSPSSGPTFVPVSAPVDDGLLGEIDAVIQSRTANELRALDELTLAGLH